MKRLPLTLSFLLFPILAAGQGQSCPAGFSPFQTMRDVYGALHTISCIQLDGTHVVWVDQTAPTAAALGTATAAANYNSNPHIFSVSEWSGTAPVTSTWTMNCSAGASGAPSYEGCNFTNSGSVASSGLYFGVPQTLRLNVGSYYIAVTTPSSLTANYSQLTPARNGTNAIQASSSACTNAELALSGNFGSGASVGSAAGYGDHCKWTVTAGSTGTGASPTITDTLVAALPYSGEICKMEVVGGTGTFTTINQTTVSQTAPVFTFNGTPTASATYIVDRLCY